MKKKLLYLSAIVLFTTLSVNAQTKLWDFGTWTEFTTGVTSGTAPVQKDFLVLVPHTSSTTNFAIYSANNYTFAADGVSGTGYLGTGGSGAATNFMPTLRYFYFNVSGACTVKVWARSGGSTTRSLFLTDGASQIATVATGAVTATGDPVILTGSVSAAQAAAGKIYLYGDNNFRIYKIEVTGANVITPALGTNTFSKESDVAVYTKDNKVLFSNIKSKTNIAVYSLTGALVKSADVTEDAALEVENGVYVVKVQSAEGEKTVKVIVQ